MSFFSRPLSLLKIIAATATVVYIADCYHVYKVYTEEMNYTDNVVATEEEQKKLEEMYSPIDGNSKHNGAQIDSKAFKKIVQDMKIRREEADKTFKQDYQERFKIAKESILFIGGGRAAFLQNAHPYVASGIVQHSDLKNSIHKRFVLTFKHVFAIAYGDWEKALKSSTEVRQLHAKVVGEIDEDVGFFKKGHRYSANNLHALYWVHQTLVEGAIFAYEMAVGRLREEEKQRYYKSSMLQAAAFGIPPETFPETWAEFKREAAVFCNSDFLAVGKDGKDIQRFLMTPPGYVNGKKPPAILVASANYVRWATFMKLPRKVSFKYFGKTPTSMDVFVFSLAYGYLRFSYRLLPKSLRYVNPYLEMLERHDVQLSYMDKFYKDVSGYFSRIMLSKMLPSKRHLKQNTK